VKTVNSRLCGSDFFILKSYLN